MQVDQATATLAAAGATFVVGLVVGFIAFQQWKVARAKFRLDLYERRLRCFLQLHDLAAVDPDDTWERKKQWVDINLESTFLFGPEVAEVVWHYMGEIETVEPFKTGSRHVSSEDRRMANEIMKKYRPRLIDTTKPYLDFSKWK